mmetsp:Transcript_15642/g.47669  ORF Transcript_15642/g.47669 Transcript_15642/m.47669 type:complete len:465 (-) Transcript_15642:137-1531(-)
MASASAPLKWGSLVVALAGVAIPALLTAKGKNLLGTRRRRRRLQMGLANLGNLCFFNSLMQSLAGVETFSTFLEGVSRELEAGAGPKAGADSFSGELHRLLDSLAGAALAAESAVDLGEAASAPDPDQLIEHMQRALSRNLDFRDQNDAQELWQLLMEIIDKEASGLQTEDESMSLASARSDATSSCSLASRGSHREEALQNPFVGFVGDSLRCSQCNSCRPMRLSRFSTITLEIPGGVAAAAPTVEECISNWLNHERLDDVECLSCSAREVLGDLSYQERVLEKCGLMEQLSEVRDSKEKIHRALATQDTAAVEDLVGANNGFSVCRRTKYKQLLLVRSPNALCLHINRRKYNAASGRFYKDDRPLRLKPRLALGQVNFDAGIALPRPTATYQLMSVIVHHGSAHGGHFTTFRKDSRDDSRWHQFSDEHVVPASFADVAASSPYMCFFEKLAEKAGPAPAPAT